MDPKAKELLDELNLDQTTGTKKPASKKPVQEKAAGIVNAGADELLGELGIDKKKSSLPGQSVGSNATGADGSPTQPNYQEILKAAQDFISADYNANRGRLDPDLAAQGWGKMLPINMDPSQQAKNPETSKIPAHVQVAGEAIQNAMRAEDLKKNPLPVTDQRFLATISDPNNTKVLKDYYKARSSQLDQDYEEKAKAIEQRYPMKTQIVSAGGDQVRTYRPDQAAYDAEMSAAKAERDKIKADLTKHVDVLADRRIYNEAKKAATDVQRADNSFIDIEKFGKKKLKILNDPTIEKIERWQAKGIPVDDGQLFNIDRAGLSAAQSALLQEINDRGTKDENGKVISIPDDLRRSIEQVDKLGRGLWDKHKDFRKQQVVRALSDKIYKNHNSFKTTTGLYNITQDDVKRAAKELGFDDSLIADVKPGDIKSANMFGTFANELAMKPAAGIGSFLGRNFRKYILGQDEDFIDYHYQELKKDFTSMLADPVDAQQLFGLDYIVDADKNSSTFLENIPNQKKGKFNWSVDAIANTATGGLGQLMSYASGAGAAGAGFKGLGLINNAETARKAGLITYAFATQYDDNYVQGKEMGLSEGAANGYSFIRSLASGFTEMIFPDYKVTDALFGPNSPATKMLLKQIEKKGLEGLKEQTMKQIFKRALLDGGINTTKETLEEFADLGADVLTTAMFKPDALKERDIPREFLETGITTAIGTILPITAGAYRQNRYQSQYIKNNIYQVGLDPAKYIQAIQEQLDAGTMTQDIADKKISVINTLNNIVNSTPDVSPVNNKPLTDQNKVDYANNLLQEKLLRQQLTDVKGDTVQEKAINGKISALEKEREEILKTATGVEVNIEGKPIMEGDKRPTLDDETMQDAAKPGSSELDWLKKSFEEKLNSPYRWAQENAKQNLARIEKDPAGYLEEWLNAKDSDSTYQFTPERRAEVEQELAQLKAAQYGNKEKDQQQPGEQGKENASTKAQSNDKGREEVLKPQEDEGEEKAPSSSNDLLPPKQREKLKAQQQAEKSKVPVEKFVADQIASDKIKAGYIPMAEADPKEFMKFVAQQANNVKEDGTFDTANDSRARALDSFGQELIDRANQEFPEYKKTAEKPAKKQPTPAKPTDSKTTIAPTEGSENVAADVSFVPLSSVNTDTGRFQPRSTEYSAESANRLMDNFDDNRLDPVVLYRDKSGKDYVLSGHSRLQAHEALNNLPDTDPRKQAAIEKGFKPGKIKARYFKGTEEEAIEFADRSNDLATKNKDYESAASLRRSREKGDTKTSITERAKEDFGKNWRYIYNLSHLNPNGKAITTLKQFESNPDKDVQSKVEKAAQWIGAVRERLPMITDQHENEMFDFLMDKTRSTKLERENDFIVLVQNITGSFDWNANEPLNLSRIKSKSVQEVSYDQEEAELKNAIKEKQTELDNLNDRLNNPKNPAYVNPNSSDYSLVLQAADKKKGAINAELTQLRKDLTTHMQNKGKILSAGINQGGLFDMMNLTPEEKTELDEELKPDGITTENIESYEQSLSNSEAVPQESGDNQQETGPVQENVQRPGNDEGGSQVENQGGAVSRPTEGGSIAELEAEYRGKTVDELVALKKKLYPNPDIESAMSAEEKLLDRVIADKFSEINKRIVEKRKTKLDEKVDAATAKKNAALEKFKKKLNDSRGTLNVGLNPEVIAAGVELMAAYAELGVFKFAEIVRDVAANVGKEFLEQKENMDALKGVYSYYRSNLDKKDRRKMDSEDKVDDFIEKDFATMPFMDSPVTAEQTVPTLPELTTQEADRLTEQYKGYVVFDEFNPEEDEAESGPIERISYIQGGNVFHVHLTNGASFPVTPEQLMQVINKGEAVDRDAEREDVNSNYFGNYRLKEAVEFLNDHPYTDRIQNPNAEVDKKVNEYMDFIKRQGFVLEFGKLRNRSFIDFDFKAPVSQEDIKLVNEVSDLRHKVTENAYHHEDKNVWRSEAYSHVLIEGLLDGKNPNGSKVNVKETMDRLRMERGILADAAKKIDKLENEGIIEPPTEPIATTSKKTKKKKDATGTASNLESDSTRTDIGNAIRQGTIFNAGERDTVEATDDGTEIIERRDQPAGSPGLLPFDATTGGKRSDTEVPGEVGQAGVAGSIVGPANPGGGSTGNEFGVQPESEPDYDTDGTFADFAGRTFEEKLAAQRAAEDLPVVLNDIQNIRTSLPILMKEQQEDVLAAEKRFYGDDATNENKQYGKAILFTNGTGTGKTLTGLGIAKRFIKRGLNNGLIVVPSDAKASDWMQEAKDFLDINVYQLKDTQDAGSGPVVTTYANFRDNQKLQARVFDWVIYDEAHKINSNATGAQTSSEDVHKLVTLSPSRARDLAKKNINYDQKLKGKDNQGISYDQRKVLDEQLKQETIKLFKKTKVVFLSATPFAYHKSLTYADGYLFNINEEFEPTYTSYSYNTPNQYNSFFVQNFGYRMKYNKLTEPEAGVDVDLLERQFTERLKKDGVVVSRKLKLDQDYSRQFVVIEDGIGNVIDEGLAVVRDHEKFPNLSNYVHKLWNYLYTARLMEAIKARASVDRIKKHLNLGRKVVVFHSYNEGMPQHPFNFNSFEFLAAVPDEHKIGVKRDIERFEAEYPQYANLDLRGLVNPIQTLTKAFGDRLLQFNGTVSKKDRKEAKRLFNDDNSGKDIIIVQMDAGKEGLSLHDKTGKHQRALLSLGLPIKPTDAIQSEGRIYRTGNQTNAVIEYPILNLNFERFMYANKIKDRVRTAENLALGEESRNLEIAFKEGYINAAQSEPDRDQGRGGKQDDARMDKTSEFDKAKTYYYKKQKRTAQQKKYVSGDYYSTPEPLGFKMTAWADIAANEKMLEPSAGHGAIGRFFPGNTNNTFIEPNTDLRAEAALNTNGEMKAGTFEDLNIINKYDAIVMNPPFGTAGKTAMEHLQKALGHLRENGRVVALVPKGKMDDRINDWMDSEQSDGFHVRARIDLPSVTFERAGTQVATQIIIIDKVTDEEKAKNIPGAIYRDLTRVDSIKELFERIEDMDMPVRMEKGTYAAPVGEKEQEIGTTESGIPIANSVSGQQGPTGISTVVKAFHAKNQNDIWVVKLLKHVDGQEFNGLRDIAKELDGYYSSYKGNGAIPGFVFKTEEQANKMQAAITGEKVPEGPKMSLGDRIRTWKLANRNGSLNSYLIPVPAIWNSAVELVALAVDAGEAIADALRKGLDYIEANYKQPWEKHKYNKEMISEMKAAGKLEYTLAPEQKTQADKILRKVANGANIITELNQVREVYDRAIAKLTDPQDIQDLEDAYQELEDYMFHNLAVQIAEKGDAVDLGLEKQTWWQKQKENWRDMHERLGTVQKKITEAGMTIDEKNDMVNRADRWKSIAVAKINEALHEVGLADVDVFVWKGTKKINDSLFERMTKEGIDYRKFNLYLYAKHAPERNAHNAKVRRQSLAEYILELEGQLASKEADLVLFPSPQLKAAVTRLNNEIALLTQYEQAYSDPNANKDKVRVLEQKIPKRFHLMDDGGSGMTNEQADEILQEVDKEGNRDKFETFEDEIREKILEKSLDLKREYGLIDQENYDYLSNYYKNYVPLRVEDEYFEDNLTFTQQKLPGAKIYQSKGANYISFEKRINPLTQAIIDLQATIYEGENNRFKQTIAEAIHTAPDSKVWEIEPAHYTPVKDKTGKILNLKETKAPDNGIPYMDHGMKKYLVLHDTALFKEISGENVKSAIPILSNINSFFRQIFTVYNPAFTVSNLFRDLQTAGAILSSNYGNDVGANFRSNVKEIHKIIRASYKEQGDAGPGSSYWEQRAKEYTEGGGQMAWFRPEVTTDIIKDVEETYEKYNKSGLWEDGKRMSLKLADFFNRANQAVETSTRLAMYDALLKSGIPQHKAIEIARNATINFNKKGNFTSPADSLYLFFNASVQGTTNLLYSLLTTKRGWKVAGGIAMIGFIQSLYNNMMSDCSDPAHPEDCYDNIPDYVKERNILIKVPGGHGFIKIPLPYGFNVFYNTGEQIAQNMQGKTTLANSASYIMKTALNSFNPLGGSNTPLLQQISPTATDPLVQWYTNRDGLGRPIYSDNQYDRRPDSEKGFASDSEWSRNFADWMNRNSGGNDKIKGKIDVAPGTLDHLFETATGGTGLFLKQLVGTGQDIVKGNDIDFNGIPILNRFYTQPKERSDRGMIYGRLDDSYNTIFNDKQKADWKTELEKAVRLGEIKPDAADRYRKAFDKNQYQLSNPELFKILDDSKVRPLEDEEVEEFVEKLQERVDNEELSINSLRAYKATITKNQKKFKEQEE